MELFGYEEVPPNVANENHREAQHEIVRSLTQKSSGKQGTFAMLTFREYNKRKP